MQTNVKTVAGPSGFLSDYPVAADRYDEMCSAAGVVRPHWARTMERLESLGGADLTRRHRECRRLQRENGVTYNVYDDPKAAWRAWTFDPIPFLIAEDNWRTLESGLIERASLWNLVLEDLYGNRELVRAGVVPPELLDADPNYLRAWHSPNRLPGGSPGRMLPLFAVDVGRRSDGSFVVIEDRGQAPPGAGYALENRIILSRVLPDVYRDAQVHRLAEFFRTMLSTLADLSSPETDPRIVILTPGPGNETYFEHAFLANYLGVTLVEGSDLVVRGRKVWLRTLEGLERVHVIVRRITDSYLDPLELRGDSMLGAAGLLNAARAGHVVLVNPPGTGVCENAGLLSLLPAIARRLLGRELNLSSVNAWWCGYEFDREYVLSHFDSIVIKPIGAGSRRSTIVPARLSREERKRLKDEIVARPHGYAAREEIRLSTTPVLAGGRLEPREAMLRTFLIRRGGTYAVMPGGLARVSLGPSEWSVCNQEGGIVKDAWVLSHEAPRDVTLLPTQLGPLELRRGGGEISSRVAENLFWLGRYAERSEGTARLLRSVVLRVLESRTATDASCPADLLRSVTHFTTSYPGFLVEDESLLAGPESELLSLVVDRRRPGSLRYNLNSLRRVSRASRDRLSHDMWRTINQVNRGLANVRSIGDAVDPLDHVVLQMSALAGLVGDGMTRGPGFWFVDVGRRMERAADTINLLRSVFFLADSFSDAMAETVLEVTDSVMTYRRRYKSRLHPAGVVDLLLVDETNPRSVAYQLSRLHELMSQAPGRAKSTAERPDMGLVLLSLGKVRATDVDSLENRLDDHDVRCILDGVLSVIDGNLRRTSERIAEEYFLKVEPPHQLVEMP